MLLSQHSILGATLAVATKNPYLGFVCAVASHQFLDTLPHIDGPLKREKSGEWTRARYYVAYADIVVTTIIVLWLYSKSRNYLILVGAFGGALVDLFDNVPYWKKIFRSSQFGRFVHRIHTEYHCNTENKNWFWYLLAVLMQLFITIGGIWVLLKIP